MDTHTHTHTREHTHTHMYVHVGQASEYKSNHPKGHCVFLKIHISGDVMFAGWGKQYESNHL